MFKIISCFVMAFPYGDGKTLAGETEVAPWPKSERGEN